MRGQDIWVGPFVFNTHICVCSMKVLSVSSSVIHQASNAIATKDVCVFVVS